MPNLNRRNFLSAAGAVGLLGGAGMLPGLGRPAHAANVEGYKALVCVFLDGGMDHADTILPYDQHSYDALKDTRTGLFNSYNVGSGSSSRDIENLLPINPINGDDFGARKFAMPRELGPLKDLFDRGNAAVIGNIGPLVVPTNRASLENPKSALPGRLFSHNDQRATWVSQGTEGTQHGWGGRFADVMASADPASNNRFSAISTNGTGIFLAGENVKQFAAPVGGTANYKYLTRKWYWASAYQSDAARQIMKEHLASADMAAANLYMKDVVGLNQRAMENLDEFLPAIENAPVLNTIFPDENLGKQLKTVAETISIQMSLNVSRQVFYVRLGGFDTHDGQAGRLPELQSRLANGIASFYAALEELGMQDNVTLFTASDFGRTLIDNGDGTDHGWGGHQFVVGGSVNGNRIYGIMPEIDLSLDYYTAERGRLIPSVSVDQYAATLGGWYGLSPSELRGIFPNLNNFSAQNLGFV